MDLNIPQQYVSQPCPSCGYCPTCKRLRNNASPQPFWHGNTVEQGQSFSGKNGGLDVSKGE